MLLQVQLGLDQGGQIPREFRDFTIMEHMGWTEEQLTRASRYCKQFAWDFIQIKRARGE